MGRPELGRRVLALMLETVDDFCWWFLALFISSNNLLALSIDMPQKSGTR